MPTLPDETTISWDVRLLDWMANELKLHGLAQSIEVITDLSKATLVEVPTKYATVIRTYLPEYDLESTEETRLTILPMVITNNWISRKSNMDLFEVHVIAQRRLPMDDTKKTEKHGDTVRTLLMQVDRYFDCHPEADLCDAWARWTPSRQPTVFTVDDVNNKHLLNCLLTTFWTVHYERCVCAPCL